MDFRREVLTPDLAKELLGLLSLHYAEVGIAVRKEVDPDWKYYSRLEEGGVLRVFTSRDPQGLLIGYESLIVTSNPHYKDFKQACSDALFIHPDRRGFGRVFMQWIDSQLKLEGVEVVFRAVTEKCRFEKILQTMGYSKVSTEYMRIL